MSRYFGLSDKSKQEDRQVMRCFVSSFEPHFVTSNIFYEELNLAKNNADLPIGLKHVWVDLNARKKECNTIELLHNSTGE